MPRLRLLALACALLLAAPLAALAQTAAPVAPVGGTPVLGPSLLSADQISAWYASTGKVSKSPTPVPLLAALMLDEGGAQGVRGDIAFAQSMLETGYLGYGGQVKPADNNFSGLGACDSCARGLGFASAQLGVRAQIQHLFAYASPTADPALLARPLADIRFTGVTPYGRAQTWEQMGNGNWATDPAYAGKVLSIWRAMLAYNGVAAPSPAAPPASPGASLTLPLKLIAARSGANLGGWALRRRPLADGIRRLGTPASARAAGATCLVRWPALGAAVQVSGPGDPCSPATATARWARLSTAAWATARGLAVGDSASKLRRLYPAARFRGGRWWLVSAGTRRSPAPRLRAEVAGGRVTALWVNIGR
ncbi:MAG: glucosaminidase domain-containing protein [Thermoleophilia bacterium]